MLKWNVLFIMNTGNYVRKRYYWYRPSLQKLLQQYSQLKVKIGNIDSRNIQKFKFCWITSVVCVLMHYRSNILYIFQILYFVCLFICLFIKPNDLINQRTQIRVWNTTGIQQRIMQCIITIIMCKDLISHLA